MPDVSAAVDILRTGGLVAFPTETVYGLGADARNGDAVSRVFAVKGRPANHPVIVHLADLAQIDDWITGRLPLAAQALASAFCPGPLTLLLSRADNVGDFVTGGRQTIGIRIPAHPLALDLLRAFGSGVVAPSANRFGKVSPTSAADVLGDLGSDVDLILDGGSCVVGIESTIVDVTTNPVTVLRRGAITTEMIEVVLGEPPNEPTGPSRAPGMMASHYAPNCRIVLVNSRAEADAAVVGTASAILDPGDNLTEYAHHLYRWLRDADRRGLQTLVIVRPIETGLGAAINERLEKAAAPRPDN